jgi:hypothetical protein
MTTPTPTNASRMEVTGRIDFSVIPDTIPSICIPRVFENISSQRIMKVFELCNVGTVMRIDLVHCKTKTNPNPNTRIIDDKKTNKKFNCAFIHLQWNNSEYASWMRKSLICGEEVKVCYDDPWFWKLKAGTWTNPNPNHPNIHNRPTNNNTNNNNKALARTRNLDNKRFPKTPRVKVEEEKGFKEEEGFEEGQEQEQEQYRLKLPGI